MNPKNPPSPGVYKFAKIFSLIVGIFLCLVSLAPFTGGSIMGGIVILLLGGFFILYFFKQKTPTPPIPVASLREEALKYITESRDSGEFPVKPTSLMLGPGEKCYLTQVNSILSEPKTVTKTVSSTRIKLAKGTYIGSGTSHNISHQEVLPVDKGELVLTNKNLYFKGQLNTRTITLSKIISIEPVSMGYNSFAIEVSQAGKQKKETLQVDNPFTWGSMIKILKAMEDNKIALKQIQFDI